VVAIALLLGLNKQPYHVVSEKVKVKW